MQLRNVPLNQKKSDFSNFKPDRIKGAYNEHEINFESKDFDQTECQCVEHDDRTIRLRK